MSRYFKAVVSIAVPTECDDVNTENRIVEHIEEMMDYSDFTLLEVTLGEQTLVDSEWLASVLPDVDDDDDEFDWPSATSTPIPTVGSPATAPTTPTTLTLNMAGVDPDSAQADDIREAFIEATTPDDDAA